MLAPFAAMLGLEGFAVNYLPELIALLFVGLTGLLLVEDLKKPLAFIRLFTRPNWNSWLVKGAWVINAFVGLMLASLALRYFGQDAAANVVRWFGAFAGAAVAGYTAFLFAQCEGRDLWQSRILLPHLLCQAVMCGAVVLMPFDANHATLPFVAAIAAALHLTLALMERYRHHETANAQQGAAFLGVVSFGPLRAWREGLIIGVGLTIAVALTLPEIAFIPALIGLLLYEHAFIRAGQLPPLS
jgi:formate-dependent nitrite reductase membrane component NrfD